VNTYEDRIEEARKAMQAADFVLLGAGAGLSAAAGLDYSGKRFTDNFADFIEKYGLEDMYSASFYPFKTAEEHWAHWARHIHVNRYAQGATDLYRDLLSLASRKEYFVITTNVESQFVKAGFPEERVFETQGNYAYLQCAKACHAKRYYNEEIIRNMLAATIDCKIPSALVPVCPVCGGEMDVNLRHNEYFVEDDAWHESCNRYEAFVEGILHAQVVYLELGVGYNTPGIIRYPFEKLTFQNKKATLIRLNRDDTDGFSETVNRTIAFNEEMKRVVGDLLHEGD
jgi:NAD-dependent SIR2 family protein deacetylase